MGCGTCVPKCSLSRPSWANLSSRLRTPLPRYDAASPICFEDFLGTPVVATNRTDPSCVTPPRTLDIGADPRGLASADQTGKAWTARTTPAHSAGHTRENAS